MNLLLLEPDELDDGQAWIGGRRAQHVVGVLKKAKGDRIVVGVVGGARGEAEILGIDPERIGLRCIFDREPPPVRPITLVLALPRPPVLRRVLQQVAALGLQRLILCHSARVEKSYWSSPVVADEQIRDNLLLGLEQAGDTRLPEVLTRRAFRPFVEDELQHESADHRWFADPKGLLACPSDVPGTVLLVVGPEGGWVPFERELMGACGLQGVHLGPRILRVETAVVALLARVGLAAA